MSPEEKAAADAKAAEDAKKNEPSELAKEIAALKASIAELTKKPKEDETLNSKVKEQESEKQKEKDVETAVKFQVSLASYVKENETLFPKEFGQIIELAEKEKYDSAVQKANATKAALVKSFFDLQENLDVLTSNQKISVEQWNKLSKTGREDRVNQIYENIFEPTVEMIKRVKKAEQVAKANNGELNETDIEKAYKDKLVKLSEAHYLRSKKNA